MKIGQAVVQGGRGRALLQFIVKTLGYLCGAQAVTLARSQVADATAQGHLAAVEDRHLLAEQLDLHKQVRVDENRDAFLFERAQDLADLPPSDRIDAIRWFVEDE